MIYENTKTRIFFEEGYAIEENDLVVMVPKLYTDAHPGGECGIAPSLSILGSDGDLSNQDHGGPVLLDDQGRLYVDVVLHNRNGATDTPLDDAWYDLTPSAVYTLCLRKKPPGARLRRQLTTITTPWWEEDPYSSWIWLPGDWIHVQIRIQTPTYTHTHPFAAQQPRKHAFFP